MDRKFNSPFPTPSELWGDYSVESWTRKQRGWFAIWLTGLASHIIFAEQPVINRVNELVSDTISKAKAGEISAEEAIQRVQPGEVFSEEDLKKIRKTASEQGKMLGEFYLKQGPMN